MLSQRFSLGAQLVIGLLPICYGLMLIAALPNTRQWVVIIGIALLILLVFCGSFGYPLQTIWPIFPGAFLLLACSAAFFQDAIDELPLTRQPGELIAMCVIAALYLAWAVRATWKAYSAFA